MSYGDASGAMGNWHKGALTTNFMRWIVDLLGKLPADANGFLMKCRCATYRVNAMFGVLYRAGAFLDESECKFVSECGIQFLQTYYDLAVEMFRVARQYLFPLYPKLHMFQHLMLEVRHMGLTCRRAVNPTMWGCQLDEDVVGRASRLSRRVSIRLVCQRALDRYLVAAHTAYTNSGLLV